MMDWRHGSWRDSLGDGIGLQNTDTSTMKNVNVYYTTNGGVRWALFRTTTHNPNYNTQSTLFFSPCPCP